MWSTRVPTVNAMSGSSPFVAPAFGLRAVARGAVCLVNEDEGGLLVSGRIVRISRVEGHEGGQRYGPL